jgi:hypothetical protein
MAVTINENISVRIEEIHKTINILLDGIQILNDDTQLLSSDSVRIKSSIETLNLNRKGYVPTPCLSAVMIVLLNFRPSACYSVKNCRIQF